MLVDKYMLSISIIHVEMRYIFIIHLIQPVAGDEGDPGDLITFYRLILL